MAQPVIQSTPAAQARLVFAFAEGATHELWGMPGLGAWAQSIGACVAIEVAQ